MAVIPAGRWDLVWRREEPQERRQCRVPAVREKMNEKAP